MLGRDVYLIMWLICPHVACHASLWGFCFERIKSMSCMTRIALKLYVMTLLTIYRTGLFGNLYILTAIQHSLPTNGMTTLHKFAVLFHMAFPTATSNNLAIDPFILTITSTGVKIL